MVQEMYSYTEIIGKALEILLKKKESLYIVGIDSPLLFCDILYLIFYLFIKL